MRFVVIFTKTFRGYRTYHKRMRILMIFIETYGQFVMKSLNQLWAPRLCGAYFAIVFSTDVYQDVIFVDVQKLEAPERDLQHHEIIFNYIDDFHNFILESICQNASHTTVCTQERKERSI